MNLFKLWDRHRSTLKAAGLAVAVFAVASQPTFAGTVGPATTGIGSTINYIWQMIQSAAFPITGIGATLGLGALYAQHHGVKEIGHGVLNVAMLGGGVLTVGGLIGAATGTAGALI